MAAKQAASILAAILAQPPGVNKYTALADAIDAAVAPASLPQWAEDATFVLIGLYGCILIVSLLSIVGCAINESKLWVLRSGAGGLWTANWTVTHALLSILFCVLQESTLIWQILIQEGKATLHGFILLHGVRWLPLYWAGCIYAHSLAVQWANHTSSRAGVEVGGPMDVRLDAIRSQRRKTSWTAWALNLQLVALPLISFCTVFAIFGVANTAANDALDIVEPAVAQLRRVAPTYNPATFTVPQILPYLLPFEPVPPYADRFNKYVRIGWIVWASLVFILMPLIGIFLIPHLRALHRLSGASSYRRSFFGSSSRSFPAPSPHIHHVDPADLPAVPWESSSSSQETIGSSTYRQKRALVAQPSPAVDRQRNAGLARSLTWSGILVWSAGLVYMPLDIWASMSKMQDQKFQIGQTMIGSGSFAIIGLAIHLFALYRIVQSWRHRTSQAAASSAPASDNTLEIIHVKADGSIA